MPSAPAEAAAALDDVRGYAVAIGPSNGNVDAPLVEAAHARGLKVLVELVINLPDEIYNQLEVQDWLKSDVIEHYFDHAV